MMDTSDPPTLWPFNNSNFTKTKERTPFIQVMTCKDSSLQRIIQVVHRVAQKSCRRACQLFCCPLDTLLCEKLTACTAPNHQPEEDKNAQVALRSPPSTILILNISNSTLIDCVIGNDTYPSAVAESQPLMHESELHIHDQARCSCSCGQQGAASTSPPPPPPPPASAEPTRISIHSSHLNCVIIGNNNYMQAEQSDYTETNEPQE